MSSTTDQDWKAIGQAKREAIAALLPPQWTVRDVPTFEQEPDAVRFCRMKLNEHELEITEKYAAIDLLRKLASAELSAVEVLDAFCHRATIAHQLTNCLSEVMFVEARARAKELDQYLKDNGKTIGPLHGLPISLKDQFRVRDQETSLGYVAWLGKKETADSESWLVTKFRDLGAVFHCKTNVPSSLMAIETNNNIIGYTSNAHRRSLSSGGSSGGEASLLSMRGSILGIGSDVGASIRLPCAFSDIVGLKPSQGRVPYLGVANSMLGHETVSSVIGPMGHYMSDLQLFLKTVLELRPWKVDPRVMPLPWRQEEASSVARKIQSKTLKIGYLRSDGMVSPHPPVLRALNEIVESLKDQGFELIEWAPPAHAEAFQILWDTFAADGGIDIHNQLGAAGEPPVPELAVSYGERVGHLPVSTVNELWAIEQRKLAYQIKYAAYWNSTGVDAIITPAAPSASYRPTQGRYFGYTGVFNVLDYSAVTIRSPVRASATKDAAIEERKPLNDFDSAVAGDYDPETFDGMPIGLQVVCQRLEEEKVLTIAGELQNMLLSSNM